MILILDEQIQQFRIELQAIDPDLEDNLSDDDIRSILTVTLNLEDFE